MAPSFPLPFREKASGKRNASFWQHTLLFIEKLKLFSWHSVFIFH